MGKKVDSEVDDRVRQFCLFKEVRRASARCGVLAILKVVGHIEDNLQLGETRRQTAGKTKDQMGVDALWHWRL